MSNHWLDWATAEPQPFSEPDATDMPDVSGLPPRTVWVVWSDHTPNEPVALVDHASDGQDLVAFARRWGGRNFSYSEDGGWAHLGGFGIEGYAEGEAVALTEEDYTDFLERGKIPDHLLSVPLEEWTLEAQEWWRSDRTARTAGT